MDFSGIMCGNDINTTSEQWYANYLKVDGTLIWETQKERVLKLWSLVVRNVKTTLTLLNLLILRASFDIFETKHLFGIKILSLTKNRKLNAKMIYLIQDTAQLTILYKFYAQITRNNLINLKKMEQASQTRKIRVKPNF